ncbi:MAG: dihydroorotase [Methanosaeta sp. PtaB.Bin039]|nr:MAG: dihydroorotase [Methanosaeta sp. PtaB.Bin039]OPY44129.1 MAG: dihydroorotase [Methanosaeta sp. PtaU1.Bin028]
MIIRGGIVYDPANGIYGEEMDLFIEGGRIAEEAAGPELDASGLLVMPGGVDAHSHIAGTKVNTGRIMRPDDSRMGTEPRNPVCRPCTGYTVPNCYAIGYRYARMGYTTAFEAATPIINARHTHEELEEIPILDKGALTLFGSNWTVLECVRDKDLAKLAAYVAWGLRASRGYGVKIVNPGGGEAWGFGANVKGLYDTVPNFDVTPAEIIESLAKANEMLGLPHSIHLHFNNLGKPGNYTTAIETLDLLKGVQASRMRQVVHIAHMQFSAYGGTGWKDFESKGPAIADYFNRHSHATMDLGMVLFGPATTMTADGPLEYANSRLLHAKWANCDYELEDSSGVVPLVYGRKMPINAIQWAIGLELALMTKDPWKVIMTTDHPNGAPFVNYPEVIALLMSRPKREEEIATVHELVKSRTALPTLEREMDWTDIAVMTRAGPARILGLEDKGHLGKGADGDVAVYNLRPDEIDPSRDHALVKAALAKARYTIKGGTLVARDGEILSAPPGRTYWVDAGVAEADANRLMADLKDKFDRYYSIQISNYMVQDAYISHPNVIRAGLQVREGEDRSSHALAREA